MASKADRPFRWHQATINNLRVICPHCKDWATPTRIGYSSHRHSLSVEVLCYKGCGRYSYHTMEITDAFYAPRKPTRGGQFRRLT